MAYKDPLDERNRAARRKHYEANKAQYFDRNAQAKKTKRDFIIAAKAGPCMDCGIAYPYYVMDFDHRPGTEKKYTVARLHMYSWAVIREELAKCDVVCSNCHRERTHGGTR